MRDTFARTVVSLAEEDERIVLLTGDLGYTVLEPFAEKFPDRFFNVGVAEQNMVGVATGMAESGLIPFVYSIVTFASLRPYEFIRNGPILHQLPVRIVGIGGGFEYGHAGVTHHGLEDIGVMRIQPGISVVAPADHEQTASALRATWNHPGPVYYRFGKDDRTVIPGLKGRFELGRAHIVREGKDLILLSTGSVTKQVIDAASSAAEQGIDCSVMVVSSLNPTPVDDIAGAVSRFKIAITVENHYVNGGLGSMVSEVVATEGIDCRVFRCGITETPNDVSGSENNLNSLHGLSPEALVKSIRNAIDEQR